MKKLNKSHKTDYVFLEVLSEIDEIKEEKHAKVKSFKKKHKNKNK